VNGVYDCSFDKKRLELWQQFFLNRTSFLCRNYELSIASVVIPGWLLSALGPACRCQWVVGFRGLLNMRQRT